MKEAVLFVILFAVLVVRPEGLFGRLDAKRD
jgi:branched-subunit amino acid ABC-type transport system permease component